jgi:catechol 2,3-dioxygenase-like lactoylglutathione lyase family enzyme
MKRPILAAFFLTSFLPSTVLLGQGVLGVGNFIHVVANLDKSIEFYHDALGLEMTGAPGPRAFSANAVVSSLYDAPGAQSRVASFKIPGSPMAVEIVEFQGLHATPVPARFFDPGAITLTLPVQDPEAVKNRLYRIKEVEWINAQRDGSVMVRDPDGIFVVLMKGDPAELRLGVTVEDVAKTTRFYQDALGFTGAGRGTMRVPGDGFVVGFANPNYADRKPLHFAIHDPGAGVLRLRVGDFDGVVKAMKAAGATVVSAGGEPVNLGRNRAVIFRDLNNFFVQVLESAPAAAKGPAAK